MPAAAVARGCKYPYFSQMFRVHSSLTTALVAALTLLTLAGCGAANQRSTRTEFLLGTTISVSTFGRLRAGTGDSVFARVREIEEKMSTSREDYADTELLRVNDAAGESWVQVSPDTFDVVSQALRYSELSEGAFDVTIDPLVRLWGIGTESEGVPAAEGLERTLELVDYGNVQTRQEDLSIRLADPGMGLDVGGIAKGYAADEAARILSEAGVESALLDFGGNIYVIGSKPDGSEWRIGIQVPDARRGEFLGIASVSDISVVTSGTYERFFEYDGKRYHHILDSQTGFPVDNGLGSVTIFAQKSIDADALSTAVFVMGLESGMAFVESLDFAEAIIVTEDRLVYRTSGVGSMFELTNSEYRFADL